MVSVVQRTARGHAVLVALGSHGLLVPRAKAPTAPGTVQIPRKGRDLPSKGLRIRARPFCFTRQRMLFSASEPPAQCLCLPVIRASSYLL